MRYSPWPTGWSRRSGRHDQATLLVAATVPGSDATTTPSSSALPGHADLTLACGKYHFSHLQSQLGDISGIRACWTWEMQRRLLRNQGCGGARESLRLRRQRLPLSLILSWYEQKAAILLTAGARHQEYPLGPTLPAFISPAVLNVLVEKFGLTPIKTADEDLASILKTA